MIRKKIGVLFTYLFFVFALPLVQTLNAQDISNISNLNVDELSDDQIKQIITEIEKRGISEGQLEVLAKARGASALQIQKLRTRILNVRNSLSDNNSLDQIVRIRESQTSSANEIENGDVLQSILPLQTSKSDEVKSDIYGMNLFHSENLTFQPSLNIPTPINYQLGPGDELIIDVWGAAEQNYQLKVSPEGNIRVPNLGPIYLNGLTVEKAESKIKARLSRIYSGLGSNTYADVSLGSVRTIKVNIVGEVSRQGTYVLSSFSSVFNALYAAGGPNENGSLRLIDHYRAGKKLASIDLYDFLFRGIISNEILNDQDVIIVRPYTHWVKIQGEVKRPGTYELEGDETLEVLINYAGGFTSKAYRERISLKRNSGISRVIETVTKSEFGAFRIIPGDEINVTSIIPRFKSRVNITGAVNKVGEYEYTDGMTLNDLIQMAEGPREDAFFDRGTIFRLNNDLSITSIAFSLNEVLDGADIILQNEDLVDIKSKFDLKEEYFVRIDGEVRFPQNYAFVDSMTVEDLILQAGGFKESAARSAVEVARRKRYDDNRNPANSAEIYNFPISESLYLDDSASDFLLQPFDYVIIRKSPYYENQAIVEVQGEVNFPGKYVIEKKNERISDLLKRSGGITSFGYVKGATLVRRSEYFSDETFLSARLRRESLINIARRDTLVDDEELQLNRRELIGISLGEIIKNPGSEYDLILKEGDVLSVPKQLETVRLRGELLYPSVVRFNDQFSFRSYVSQAGGFSGNAKKGKSYVVYANGEVKRTKSMFWINFYPKIEPGAEVIVPEKPQKSKLSSGEVLSLTTGIATFGLVILRLVDEIQR